MSGRRLAPDEAALWRSVADQIAPLGRGSRGVGGIGGTPGTPGTRGPGGLGGSGAARAFAGDRRHAPAGARYQARLDLHGLTLAEAHGALDEFLDDCASRGLRRALVITGKGRVRAATDHGPAGPQTLRRKVPRWLQEGPNRGRVLALAPAEIRDGGDGALYVTLRRTGKSSD